MAIAMITSTTLNSCQLMDSRLENPSPVAHSRLCLQNRPRFQRLSVVVCASPLQNQSSAYLERRLVTTLYCFYKRHMQLLVPLVQLQCRIVAMLEKNGTLKIANVGDCGLRILRQGQVVFSTSPQEHYFDCPFQLSSEIGGQTYKDAVVHSIEVMEGDTVVMGSDGLFDNVFDHEIESVVNSYEVSDLIVAKKTAKALADLANEHARDTEFESPYCLEARIQGHDVPIWKKLLGMKLTGGKLDDITVIVGTVVNARVLPQGSIHLDGDKYLPDAFPYNGEPESLLEGRPLTNEVPSNINDPYQESAGIP